MIPTLETQRLVLPQLELADAEQVQVLFGRWEIVRYLAARVPWPYPPDGALTFYRDVAVPGMQNGVEWHWTIRLKTKPKEIIGSISVMTTGMDNRGFWLGLPWQQQGFMTEACDVVTNYWFESLRFPVLRVSKAAENIPSRRICEKQGMRLVGIEERDYVCGRLPAEIWEITAEEWARHRRK